MFDPNAPRKPFVARGSRIERCADCFVSSDLCLCDAKPNMSAQAAFWLMTHHNEVYKPTNTGRLVLDAIADSQLLTWSRTEPDPHFLALLQNTAYQPCIVFPAGEGYEDRMVSAQQLAASGKKPALILLDGTWRQARRMFRLSRYLDELPVIEPLPGRESRYDLRQAVASHHLSTAEVAAAVLEDLGDRDSAAALNAYFDLFNAAYYASRRQLDLSEKMAAARTKLAELSAQRMLQEEK